MKKYSQSKKLISFTLAFALLISLFSILPLTASAADATTFTDEQGLTYTVNDDGTTVKVTGFDKKTTKVTIPGQIKNEDITYTVTEIGSVFSDCSDLQSVELNEGIETIYNAAFLNCTSLSNNIVFPKSMKTINSNAFRGCTSLKSVEFNSDLILEGRAFFQCTGLEKVTCNSLNINFNSVAFANVDTSKFTIYGYEGSSAETFANEKSYKFEKLTVDPAVLNSLLKDAKAKSEIMYTADSYKPLAEAIKNAEDILKQGSPSASDIQNSIKAINEAISNLVADNTTDDGFIWQTINEGKEIEIIGLTKQVGSELTIPSEIKNLPVTSIGEKAIFNVNYKNIIVPDSVTIIKKNGFSSSVYLKKITFSENSQLETIEDNAFAVDASVTSDNMSEISLPASLKSIGGKAFAGRQNLLMVTVNSKDVKFGNNVFEGNDKLTLTGYENSTAETYAKQNGYKFRYLDLNTDELQKLYDQANAVDSSLYTADSYAKLTEAMNAAKKLLGTGSKNATPAQVREAEAALNAAIEGLVPVGGAETTAPVETTVEATDATTVAATEATTVAAETTAPAGGTIEVLLGDADGSQKVDVKDVTHIQKHIAAYFTLEGANALAADVDGSGVIDVNDVTYVQKYLAAYKVDYKIGEVVQFGSDTPAPTEEMPQPTDEQPTTSAQDPTTAEPEPTTAEPEPTVPENATRFYIPNYVSWLNNDGCKLWLYNDDTDGLLAATEYEENPDGLAGYFYFDLPNDWVNISIYRTAYEITPETFDKDSPWDEATKTGIILNSWLNIGDRGENNAYKIIGDGEPGVFETFDPDEKKPDENERTIYFDNSKTHWATVYVYGWSYGLNQEWAPMEFEGDDIWSYTFYDDLPIDGVKGFLFVNQSDVWDGARQTADMATEAGKNLFVPSGAGNVGQKLTGTWDVYNP